MIEKKRGKWSLLYIFCFIVSYIFFNEIIINFSIFYLSLVYCINIYYIVKVILKLDNFNRV